MIWAVILVLAFVIGVAVGRWWALAIAIAFGAWIWADTDVEIPHWLLAAMYGGTAAQGIAVGVAVRRRLTASR